jgi:hypothetical protein
MKQVTTIAYMGLAPEEPEDGRMSYYSPGVLERIQGASLAATEYGCLKEYLHLRRRPINLETLALTDRQLTAVSLVFYGGVKKNRAARAMSITAQSLDEHLKAALKKIENGFCS